MSYYERTIREINRRQWIDLAFELIEEMMDEGEDPDCRLLKAAENVHGFMEGMKPVKALRTAGKLALDYQGCLPPSTDWLSSKEMRAHYRRNDAAQVIRYATAKIPPSKKLLQKTLHSR